MNRLNKLLTVIVAVSSVMICVVESFAQCVECKTSRAGFYCAPSTSGGSGCITDADKSCTIISLCRTEEPKPKPPTSPPSAERSASEVVLDQTLIREIGATHPRFAIAIATLNSNGALTRDQGKIYLMPVEISSGDVEWWLKPEKEAAPYFKRFAAKSRILFERGVPPIVYEYILERSADSSLAIIKLRVVKGYASDPSYTSLEIDLAETENSDPDTATQRALRWRIY